MGKFVEISQEAFAELKRENFFVKTRSGELVKLGTVEYAEIAEDLAIPLEWIHPKEKARSKGNIVPPPTKPVRMGIAYPFFVPGFVRLGRKSDEMPEFTAVAYVRNELGEGFFPIGAKNFLKNHEAEQVVGGEIFQNKCNTEEERKRVQEKYKSNRLAIWPSVIRIPMNVGHEDGYCISLVALILFWQEAIEKGYDPNELKVKCYELGDGSLQFAFRNQSGKTVLGWAIPQESPGFWWTFDGRVPPDMVAFGRENSDALSYKMGLAYWKSREQKNLK